MANTCKKIFWRIYKHIGSNPDEYDNGYPDKHMWVHLIGKYYYERKQS